ncbi:MAG: N-acetylmuramoyl-L-alanine amidase [Candidatus Omnitrophica bacterium]|nr:N-acetylmuramoyl-L-alanine amidase [Candidatus Omnitrophota bacterium]
MMLLTLHGCGGRPAIMVNQPAGISLKEICDRYHVLWQWDSVSQVVTLEYKGNQSKALVGSSTVLVGKQQIVLSAPLRRERSMIFVPEDFEAQVLAPFGVPIGGLGAVESSSRVHTIVIDAGHGGKDRGTIVGSGTDEKEIVLDVAKRLEVLLENAGIKVVMTRDTDNFISLPQRTVIASRSGADLFISIHVNSNKDHSVNGLLVYYLGAVARRDVMETQRRSNERTFLRSLNAVDSATVLAILTDMMDTLKSGHSQKLAKLIVRSARETEGIKVRGDGVRLCHFFVVRNTLMPAVLVETGFLSNHQEHSKLVMPTYRQKLAQAVARGILDYANE